MANRYWVGGGDGNWSSTTNWSGSSGGASGASVPGLSDAAFFDAASGSVTATLDISPVIQRLTMTGFTGTLDFSDKSISLNSTGTVYLGATTFSVSGNPVINLVNNTSSVREVFPTGVTEANSINFNIVSGSGPVTLSGTFRDINFTGFGGQLNSNGRTLFGDLILSPSMTVTASGNVTTFASTSVTPRVIAANGVLFNASITINGVGGSFVLGSDITMPAARVFTLTNGTFNASGYNISVESFSIGAGTKTLALGSGITTITGANWNANTNVANLTVSPSSGVISMTSASAKTFAGGAKTWPTLNQGGAGALTIQQSNTFANITNTVQPATITLTAGTTQTVDAFGVSGTAGNLITLNTSTAGTRATLADTGGTNEVSFVSIKDINATGGAVWSAFLKEGNVNAGNNLGWDFFPAVRQIFRQVFRSIFRPIF